MIGRALASTALLAFAAGTHAFTVEVGEIVGLLDIEVTATALDRSAVIKVVNHDTVAAECELIIDSGPDEQVRRVVVPASGSRLVTQAIRPSTQRVRIRGTCR